MLVDDDFRARNLQLKHWRGFFHFVCQGLLTLREKEIRSKGGGGGGGVEIRLKVVCQNKTTAEQVEVKSVEKEKEKQKKVRRNQPNDSVKSSR